MSADDVLDDLWLFRSLLRGCFNRRGDALFEPVDALLLADAVPSCRT